MVCLSDGCAGVEGGRPRLWQRWWHGAGSDAQRLPQTSYCSPASQEAANHSAKQDHGDQVPAATTRGKTRETHHGEAGGEASGGCVSVWHKASVCPGLWKRICTIPAAAALLVGRGSLILCTSAASSEKLTHSPHKKNTSKCPLRCNTARRRAPGCRARSPRSGWSLWPGQVCLLSKCPWLW